MSVRSLSAVKLQIKNESAAQKQKKHRDNLNRIDGLKKEQTMLQDEVKILEDKLEKIKNEEDEDIFDLDGDNL